MTRDEWIDLDTANAAKFDMQMAQLIKSGSAAERDFYKAAWAARTDMQANNLLPSRTEYGGLEVTDYQANLAATLAREDAATTAQLQLKILQRLDRNRNYLAVVAILLVLVLSS
jgi:hypothetical protein